MAHFAQYLDISDDALTIAIGAWSQDYSVSVDAPITVKDSGAVFVWGRYTSASSSYVYEQHLVGTTPAPISLFGCSIALSGNRLAIGARNHNSGNPRMLAAGVVYVYEYDISRDFGSRWYNPLTSPEYVKPDISIDGDKFGHAIALTEDWLYVGTYDNTRATSSKLYVFQYNAGTSTWVQKAFLTDTSGYTPNIAKFGYALDVDGFYLLVGCPNDDSSRPTKMGYALVSIPRAYQCSGYGITQVGSNDVALCQCDPGYGPNQVTTISGKEVKECTTCQDYNGYFPTYGSGGAQDLYCSVCSGHGEWNATVGYCACAEGWRSPPGTGTSPCSTCASGYEGTDCHGIVNILLEPGSGTYLATEYRMTAYGVEVANDWNGTIHYRWAWRKPNSNTTYAAWQRIPSDAPFSPQLVLAPTYGLPIGVLEVEVQLWRSGRRLSATTARLTVGKSSDVVSDFTAHMADTVGFSVEVRVDPVTGYATTVITESGGTGTLPDDELEALLGLQKLSEQVNSLGEEGLDAAELTKMRTAVLLALQKVFNATDPAAYDATPVAELELLTQVLSEVLYPGQINDLPAYPSAMDVSMDLVTTLVGVTARRPDLGPGVVLKSLDRLWECMLVDSKQDISSGRYAMMQNQMAAQRREVWDVLGLDRYQQMQANAAQLSITQMNNTDTGSVTMRGSGSSLQVAAGPSHFPLLTPQTAQTGPCAWSCTPNRRRTTPRCLAQGW